jgi:hypothetical protein
MDITDIAAEDRNDSPQQQAGALTRQSSETSG